MHPTRQAVRCSMLMCAILALATGDRVTHDAWGLGTVVDTRGSGEQAQAQIDFGSAGVKWLVLRYAALEKL